MCYFHLQVLTSRNSYLTAFMCNYVKMWVLFKFGAKSEQFDLFLVALILDAPVNHNTVNNNTNTNTNNCKYKH